MVLLDPVIHLYWAHALARAEEMLKVSHFPTCVCGAQAYREHVTLEPKKITCPASQGEEQRGRSVGSGLEELR